MANTSDSGAQPSAPVKKTRPKAPVVFDNRPLTRPIDKKELSTSGFYSLISYLSILAIPATLGLIGYTFYERTHKVTPPYFAPNAQEYENLEIKYQAGESVDFTQLRPTMRALNKPNLSPDVLLKWATEATTAAYNFDFFNYRDVLKSIRPYFTEAGYNNFIASLTASQTINDVTAKKLVVSSVITGNPVIVNEGATPDGTYAWQVQFPLLITYQSASELAKQNMIVTLLIATIPTTESPKGVGIASFVLKRLGG